MALLAEAYLHYKTKRWVERWLKPHYFCPSPLGHNTDTESNNECLRNDWCDWAYVPIIIIAVLCPLRCDKIRPRSALKKGGIEREAPNANIITYSIIDLLRPTLPELWTLHSRRYLLVLAKNNVAPAQLQNISLSGANLESLKTRVNSENMHVTDTK